MQIFLFFICTIFTIPVGILALNFAVQGELIGAAMIGVLALCSAFLAVLSLEL